MIYTEAMKILLIFLLFLPGGLAAQESKEEPSLAGLVRKEKERRKGIKTNRRVITNADLPNFRRARVSTKSASQSKGSRDSGPPGSEAEVREPNPDVSTPASAVQPAQSDLQFWESAFSQARLNLKQAVDRVLVLQLKMNDLRNAVFIEESSNRRRLSQQQLDETLQDIERNQFEIEQARRALEVLQEKAEKAGLEDWMVRTLAGETPESEEAALPGFSGHRLSESSRPRK